MESATAISWSDLPIELVERIGNCPGITHIDALRLRAVCTTWRSAIPPFKNSAPNCLPIKLTVPIISIHPTSYGHNNHHLYLNQSTVYLFQPLDDHGASNNPSSSNRSGWLVKFMQTADGKLWLVNPLCHKQVLPNPEHVPNNVLNLLDFRVSQVCKTYNVQYLDPSIPCFQENYDLGHFSRKVLLISTNHNFSLMALHIWGKLSYYKSSGDEKKKWTRLKGHSCDIVDIVVYKENFYAVDRYGDIIKFDSSLNEIKVASRLYNNMSFNKKRLIESSGQLFLVDMFPDDRFDGPRLVSFFFIKVYRLNEEKHKWTQVHTLGDRIFFVGDDCCFSVSSKDLGDDQYRGYCIYYRMGRVYMGILNRDRCPVFSIEESKLGSMLSFLEYGDFVWRPPSQDKEIEQQVDEL